MSLLTFPSVEVLGLCSVVLAPLPLQAATFPSLRHLGLESCGFDRSDTATLTALASQLDSLTLTSDLFPEARSTIPSLPLDSILVNLPWYWAEKELKEQPVANLRLLISEIRYEGSDEPSADLCSTVLSSFVSLLKNPRKFTRLATIYLPSLSSLSPEYRTEEILASIKDVVLAAKDRNIEVILEEQTDELAAECQISEDFMRRMTQKRVDREAGGRWKEAK
ncbi:uncharacterized protein JCM6883_007528 [Sporobolomyces salmoneus]|uniref:uncharacterized protein n=1 Tax=Sporobolomyces salmoneus TaxID=183962 RepID=UPI003180577D